MLEKMAGHQPCLACDHAYGELYRRGFGELSFALRKIADLLWASDGIPAEQRVFVNDRLASIVQNVTGEDEKSRHTIQEAIRDLDHQIGTDSELGEYWHQVKMQLMKTEYS